MLRAGMTQQDVAEHYTVTQAAVSLAIKRGHIKMDYDRVGDDGMIPWAPIKREHRGRYLVKMLRAARRRELGLKNSPALEADLDLFLSSLTDNHAVVHYEPETEQGFFRVPRRDGVDTWLVRDPSKADDGSLIMP